MISFTTFRPDRSASTFLVGAALLAFFFLAHAPLSGQLKWITTQIDQTLTLGQERAEAVFHFENAGTYPVVIRSTSSSCGCTTAELEQRTYQPGEQGKIITRFEVGGRTDLRRNIIQVHTDDPSSPVTALVFAVEIPTLVTITPRILQWRVGSAMEKKSIRVQMNPDANVKLVGIEGDDENFKAVLVEGDSPHEYNLEITPLQTNSPGRAVLSLQTDPKIENQPNFSFYAFIR